MNFSTDARTQPGIKESSSVFEKAVVIEVGLTDQMINPGESGIPIARIPRNSLLVRRIGDIAGTPSAICFPFFSSHMQLPVKPGETVWVYFDTPVKSIGYWISRVHGDAYAEDVNFSHFDRGIIDPIEENQRIGLAEKTGKASMPEYEDFPNNSMTQKSVPGNDEGSVEDLPPIVDEYEKIINQSISYRTAKLEPIPRISKRVGDFVIQGSNNSSIVLGTAKGWKKENEDFSETISTSERPRSLSGTIDIVAGRSRLNGKEISRTSAALYPNSRGFVEVLKDHDRRNQEQNPAEGDPDFFNDASRIYVTMNSQVDVEFSLESSLPNSFFKDDVKELTFNTSPAIAIKSDEIRLIARKDSDKKIRGSVKIVKEGDSSNDASSILMLPDGTIQMSALRFVIGRGEKDGGAADGPEGDDNIEKLQPYVKYKQLEDLFKAIMADIKSFCDTLSTHTTPGYGAPSTQINQAASTLKSAMDSREGEIVNLKSKRIFGE